LKARLPRTRLHGSALRVAVLGWIVRGPMGGIAWHYLNYVLGLLRLGHDVLYVEDSGDVPGCYNPRTMQTSTEPAYGLEFAANAFGRLGLEDRWAYHDAHSGTWHGGLGVAAERWCREADVVINISGANTLRPWLRSAPVRALIDTDPLFTQVRHLQDATRLAEARRHNVFFTFGESIGTPGCTIPDDGLPWQGTRQPVALEAWPHDAGSRDRPITTVMQWQAYASVTHGRRTYGMKSRSFEPFMDLPKLTGCPFEIALLSPPEVAHRLIAHEWKIRDPGETSGDPWEYQRYIQRSAAEFSVAKHGYVASKSGWFSERSAAYLASGRPVIVQDTGFSRHMPAGLGILRFDDLDQAAAAVEDMRSRYELHAAAARDLASTQFGSDGVLGRLLDRAHRAPSVRASDPSVPSRVAR
jgi:hypothetical protein